MTLDLECTYCGFKWQKEVYAYQTTDQLKCENGNCKDSNLKIRDLSKTKIDTYKGCPPFPKKDKQWGNW